MGNVTDIPKHFRPDSCGSSYFVNETSAEACNDDDDDVDGDDDDEFVDDDDAALFHTLGVPAYSLAVRLPQSSFWLQILSPASCALFFSFCVHLCARSSSVLPQLVLFFFSK